MAAKKKAEEQQNEATVKTLDVKVPSFEDYYMEANEFDPNSRSTFDPFRFSLIRQGKSGAVLDHISKGDHTLPNPFPAVLIYTNDTLECRCTPKGDTKTTICRSPNRRFSISGFKCDDCPYKEKHPTKDYLIAQASYQIQNKKNYFLMPLIDDELVLARYKSTFKNIENLKLLANKVRAKCNDLGIEAATRVVINVHIAKVTENNNEVYRPDPNNVDIIGILEDGSWNSMGEFIKKLTQFEKQRSIRNSDYVKGRYKLRKEEDSLASSVSETVAPPTNTKVVDPPAQQKSIAEAAKESYTVENDDDDDDLPF